MPGPVPHDRLCIHQATLMQCDFGQSVECLARHGVRKTTIWRDKLDAVGAAQAARILRDAGVEAVSYCAGGFLTARASSARAQAIEDNRRWIAQAAEIGARSLVVITGGLDGAGDGLDSARHRALDGLEVLVEEARAAGLRLALEPLHPMVCGFRSVISTLREANDMLERLAADDVMGLVVDSYALWWDAGLEADIARAGRRIVNLHVSDWLAETRDVRLDRGMPGDGLIDNRAIRAWIEATGFQGPVEVEIFSSADWWTRAPDDVVRTILDRSAFAL